jgi:hypothetical protein
VITDPGVHDTIASVQPTLNLLSTSVDIHAISPSTVVNDPGVHDTIVSVQPTLNPLSTSVAIHAISSADTALHLRQAYPQDGKHLH